MSAQAPLYKPGDRVTFTNDYGVVFEGKTIISVDTSECWHDKSPRYYYEPSDSPWFSVPERNLTKEQ